MQIRTLLFPAVSLMGCSVARRTRYIICETTASACLPSGGVSHCSHSALHSPAPVLQHASQPRNQRSNYDCRALPTYSSNAARGKHAQRSTECTGDRSRSTDCLPNERTALPMDLSGLCWAGRSRARERHPQPVPDGTCRHRSPSQGKPCLDADVQRPVLGRHCRELGR